MKGVDEIKCLVSWKLLLFVLQNLLYQTFVATTCRRYLNDYGDNVLAWMSSLVIQRRTDLEPKQIQSKEPCQSKMLGAQRHETWDS